MSFKKIISLALFFLLVTASIIFVASSNAFENVNSDSQSPPIEMISVSPKLELSQNETLYDKVLTFLSPNDSLFLDEFYLEKHYTYLIYMEIVTPHNCSMRVIVEDCDNASYYLFNGKMDFRLQYAKSYEVPFGTALSGYYNFLFLVNSSENLNILIKISKGVRCLEDKINLQNVAYYNVSKISNNYGKLNPDFSLKTDFMYECYIGRVSAIAEKENVKILMNCSVEAPDGTIFTIYSSEIMANLSSINRFNFGTAIGGRYVLELVIYGNYNNINVGVAAIEDYQLSEVNTGSGSNTTNSTESDGNSNTTRQILDNEFLMPFENNLGTFLSVGGTTGALVVAAARRRKKNMVRLDLGKK